MDKVNSNLWGLVAYNPDTNGQYTFNFNTLKISDKKKLDRNNPPVIVALTYDDTILKDVNISKMLTAYDKKIYTACASLYNAGNKVFSLAQIYRVIKKTNDKARPSSDQLKKINESITKLSAAKISIDNTNESELYNYKYPVFNYDSYLLPMERISAYITSEFVESAIHLFREPPLISFARSRNQITTVQADVFKLPVQMTEQNCLIDDYLIETINTMKSGRRNKANSIILATVYDKLKVKRNKDRVFKMCVSLLEHYKETGFIKDFEFSGGKNGENDRFFIKFQ